MSEENRYMNQILEVRHQSPEKERDLCLKLLEMNETEYARAFAHTYLADAFHSMGMLDKAMDEYHAAMDLMGKKEYDKLFLTLYNLAGVIYIGQDDEQGALDCFFKEIEIAEQMEDYMMCSAALANIAYVYRKAGAYGKSEATLKRAFEMAQNASENESNVAFGEEFYNMFRAGLELEKGKPDKALEYLGSLDKLKEDHLNVPLLYASCYAQKGMKEEAMAGLGKIWEQIEDIQNRFERLSHYFDILDILMALKEYEDAARFTAKTERLLVGMECAGKWTRLMEYEIQIYTELGKEEPLERAYELFFQYDMKFKEISKQSAVKRLKKRIELQKEADRRTSMEEWQNVLFKRNEYDELTGVLNRRGIRKYMNKAFAAAREQKQKFAVLFVDVDFFKEFNDTYGHVAGDECLKKIAHILKHAVADKGMAGRYGGDEFLLTITGIQTISIMEVAMEIKKSLTKVAIPNKNSAVSDEVTVTIGGVNSVPEEKMDFPCYIEAADRMLYSLKKSSKNGFAINESVLGDEK